jgi:general secretion pathway protein E
MSFEQRYIGEILVRRGALEPDRLEAALETAADRAIDLTDFLVATHAIEEDKVVRALADEVGMEFVEKIATDLIPEELIDAVPINFARQNRVLLLSQSEDSVRVAVANPLDPFPVDDLRILLGKTILPVAASEETIDDAINGARRGERRRGGRRASRPDRHDRRSAGDSLGQQPVLHRGQRARV